MPIPLIRNEHTEQQAAALRSHSQELSKQTASNSAANKRFLSTTARLMLQGLHSTDRKQFEITPPVSSPTPSNVIDINRKKKELDEQQQQANDNKRKLQPEKDAPAKCARCGRLGHTKTACIQPKSPKEGPSL